MNQSRCTRWCAPGRLGALPALGAARADEVRRPRARDGGDGRALEQAKAGHGQIVAAVGEAGAGKSRLMYEFKATIPDRCKVLEAYSVSHGKASAWLPVIELLKNYFEIADEDDTDRRSEKVEAKARAKSPSVRHAPIAADSVALRRTARRSRGDFQVPSPISFCAAYTARAPRSSYRRVPCARARPAQRSESSKFPDSVGRSNSP